MSLLAEGAAAESFSDEGARGMFRHQSGVSGVSSAACASRIEHGPALEAIRARLRARANTQRAA